jgi:hypothetical protein
MEDSQSFLCNTGQIIVGLEKPRWLSEAIDIYPNPSNGIFTVKLDYHQLNNSSIEVYNFSGRMVFSDIIESGELEVDLRGMVNGMYLLSIKNDELSLTRKVFID